jgi:MoaA/NifB/PqqE/SkfB family radical SAM enzyme
MTESKFKYLNCCFDYSESKRKLCWLITRQCNLKCIHCSINSNSEISCPEFSDAELSHKLKEFKENDITDIIFSGGEPTLRNDFIDLVSYFSERGFITSIVTNGITLNNGYCKELKIAGIRKATVSIDGARPQTHDKFRGKVGAFVNAINGIRSLIEKGIAVTMNVTIHDENLSEFNDIIQLAITLDVTKISFIFPLACGRYLANRKLFLKVSENKNRIIDDLYSIACKFDSKLEILVLDPQCGSPECPSNKSIFGADRISSVGQCIFKHAVEGDGISFTDMNADRYFSEEIPT